MLQFCTYGSPLPDLNDLQHRTHWMGITITNIDHRANSYWLVQSVVLETDL